MTKDELAKLTMHDLLVQVASDTSYIRNVLEVLIASMHDAKNANGVQGMFARQVLPDMSAFEPVTDIAQGE